MSENNDFGKDLDDMEWWARICLFIASIIGLVILIVVFAIGINTLMTTNASAKEPATIKLLGDPAAKRFQCEARRRFVAEVKRQKTLGNSIETVLGMMLARAVAAGLPEATACGLMPAINEAWDMEGTAAEASLRVFTECMGDSAV